MSSLYDVFKEIYAAENPCTVLQTLECLLKATQKIEVLTPTTHQYVVAITGYIKSDPGEIYSDITIPLNCRIYFNDNEIPAEFDTDIKKLQYLINHGISIKRYPACGTVAGNGEIKYCGTVYAGFVLEVKAGSHTEALDIINQDGELNTVEIDDLQIHVNKRF